MNRQKLMTVVVGAGGAKVFQFGPNVCPNPGFETPGAGGADIFGTWIETIPGGGAIADELAIVHGGAHAIKFTAGVTASPNVSTGGIPGFAAGETWRFGFWAYGDGTNPGRYKIQTAASVDVVALTLLGSAAAAYTYFYKDFVIPAATAIMVFFLYAPVVNSGGIAYFDDISITKILNPNP